LVHLNLLNYNLSESYLKRTLKINPTFLDASINLSKLKFDIFQETEGIKILKNSYKKNNKSYELNLALGHAYEQIGDFVNAKTYLENCLNLESSNYQPYLALSTITKFTKDSPLLTRMIKEINEPIDNQGKFYLHFALGKAYEDLKDYENSFNHINIANNLKNTSNNYTVGDETISLDRYKKYFEDIQILPSNNIKKLIFIVGMPRSGTSLVEQILSSHEKVFGAGELGYLTKIIHETFLNKKNNFIRNNISEYNETELESSKNKYFNYLNDFAFKEEFLTDKAPLNFQWIGFILKIFPGSKIINCERDAMDTCWSNYKNHFVSKDLNFTYNFTNLGNFYKFYQNLMNYWKMKFNDKIHNIKYEDLIQNNKIEIEKLLKFCELDWDEKCLEFYKNKRKVSTASMAQVRSPVYKSSIEKWKLYSKFLDKLKKIISN
jgi:hypothetical protein